MPQQLAKTKHRIEAILFASGAPIEDFRLAQVLGEDVQAVARLIAHMNAEYGEQEGPFRILTLENRYQMATSELYAADIKAALDLRRNIPLSQAAMETLAIIAYNQPVTRAFIEQIRGVDCSYVVNSLVEKELIEEAGRLDVPGRPISYVTSSNFLRCFGLSSLEELPQVEEEPAPDPEGEPQLEGQLALVDPVPAGPGDAL